MIPILLVAVCASLLSFQVAKDAAHRSKKASALIMPAFIGLCAYGVLRMGFNDAWPSVVGWVVFLAGFLEGISTKKETPPFEIVPVVTDDPTVGSWATLFCLPCNIQTKVKRTFPPDPPAPCPRCGKPLQG